MESFWTVDSNRDDEPRMHKGTGALPRRRLYLKQHGIDLELGTETHTTQGTGVHPARLLVIWENSATDIRVSEATETLSRQEETSERDANISAGGH
jgi:hypothetical protein